jgi:hypothetical protein
LVRKSGKISHETYRYKCMDKIKTDSKWNMVWGCVKAQQGSEQSLVSSLNETLGSTNYELGGKVQRICFCVVFQGLEWSFSVRRITRSSGKNLSPTFLWYDMDHTEYNTPKILHCGRNVFTKLLPSNNKGIHRQTHRL